MAGTPRPPRGYPATVTMGWILPDADDRLDALARRARAGDREAFRRLYRALYPVVSGFVGRRVRNPEDAEDLVSRSFHRLLERIDRFDPRRGNVRMFVLGIARNAVIDQRRAARSHVPVEPLAEALADPAQGALEGVLRDEEARAVREWLAALPEEVREMFALRFGDGLRHAEIAWLTGASEAAVKQRFSRALKDLKGRGIAFREGVSFDHGI